jgi:hypothetical protein
MSRPDQAELDRRELELTLREAELNRRESQLVRTTAERALRLDAREQELHDRESALAAVAAEVADERTRLTCLHPRLEEARRLEQRRAQSAFAAAGALPDESDWWAKVLGRAQLAAAEPDSP